MKEPGRALGVPIEAAMEWKGGFRLRVMPFPEQAEFTERKLLTA